MTHGFYSVLLAFDGLQTAVAQELASRYCPHSVTAFLTRFWALFAVVAAAALALFFTARRTTVRPSRRAKLYVAAGVLLLFAIGSAAIVFYGLSGCGGSITEGLTWDWP